MSDEKRAAPARRRIKLERSYEGTVQDVWELWTTKEGIEAWWGPDGFAVEVRSIDLRPGGELFYVMRAVGAEQVAFMKRAGMPVATEARVRYREVEPPHRLVYVHLADFIPGVAPYDVFTQVELFPAPGGVRLELTFDAMHDDTWTARAVTGWEMELRKLAGALESRPRRGADERA